MHQQRFLQFGTLIDISLISNTDQALKAFDDIENLLTQRHQQWHGWEDGTLKQFNDAIVETPETGVSIPPILDSLIRDSIHYYTTTNGLFNPAIGKLIAAWGFHDHSEPDLTAIQRIKKNIPGMHDLVINNHLAYSRNPELQLDFGAIAKGLAVKQIAQLLLQHNIQNFIINAGGDIYADGLKKQNQHWRVAIEDPFEPGIISTLETDSGSSIFTSGNYQRFYRNADGSIRHHIINPKTGEPSEHISSATVLHSDPVVADVAATTLMLTEITSAKAMADKLDISDYMIINEQKEVFISLSLLSKLDQTMLKRFKVNTL